MFRKLGMILATTCLIAACGLTAGPAPKSPEELFQAYTTLERQYNPALATLYDDSARIVSRQKNASEIKSRLIPGRIYKHTLEKSLPQAEAKGDAFSYSQVTMTAIDGQVRIRGQRYSEREKVLRPFSLLAGPDAQGHWRIFQETKEENQ